MAQAQRLKTHSGKPVGPAFDLGGRMRRGERADQLRSKLEGWPAVTAAILTAAAVVVGVVRYTGEQEERAAAAYEAEAIANTHEYLEGTLRLHKGVNVRHEPRTINGDSVNPDTNIAFTVGDVDLIVASPVIGRQVGTDGQEYFGFTINDPENAGQSVGSFWVSEEEARTIDPETGLPRADFSAASISIPSDIETVAFHPDFGFSVTNEARTKGGPIAIATYDIGSTS